jgi:hypothetical protein
MTAPDAAAERSVSAGMLGGAAGAAFDSCAVSAARLAVQPSANSIPTTPSVPSLLMTVLLLSSSMCPRRTTTVFDLVAR